MRKRIIAAFNLLFLVLSVHAQQTLTSGLVISKSTNIETNEYRLKAPDSLNKALIIIEGNNIVVDFKNAVLDGNVNNQMPGGFGGVAILVRNGKNVTIKNLKARGYKVALMARNTSGLKIENCDFSYNYRQHLNSTQEKEDISDWLSHHHNEKDEWLRYGAAIYLRDCNNFSISECKVTGGQNALMMTGCNDGMAYNNDFSFNSGLGIGMYQSSRNKILYNKLDFNVRGYSHGVYNRGQDSAGILIYEQSSDNMFYNNSVTHGGDGFFLWAGQTTMDNGKGGCNGNIIWNNDFSYAPTNGVEVTFSSNQIIGNRIFECDHGIWGGYSYNTEISNNQFRNNRIAIAIEHGQHNTIDNNIFYKDGEAIRLWSRPQQPSDWGYGKYHDTRSVDYTMVLNSFNQNPLVYNITGTDSIRIFNNRYSNVERIYKIDSSVTHLDTAAFQFPEKNLQPPVIKNPINPFKGNAKFAGRKNILVNDWGPYDFRYPLIWNTNPVDTSDLMQFDVLGPQGKWKIISAKGVAIDSTGPDKLPSGFTARKLPASRTDIEINAVYTGGAFTDQFGNEHAANVPYHFTFAKFFQPIDFSVRFFDFDSLTNPITNNSIQNLQQQTPFKTEMKDRLEYAWWGGITENNQKHTQFLNIAEGSAELDSAVYELSVTWDDAVRVYIDGSVVVDEWTPSQYSFDESPNKKIQVKLSQGKHRFRVEHVELGGFATLSVKLKKL